MLRKLLKYDLKAIFKPLLLIYGITILFAIIQKVSSFIAEKWTLFQILNGFITTFYIVLLIILPIGTLILSLLKYYQNLSKDEGYLMHTLPVSKGNLVLSKLIVSCISMATTLIVMLLAGTISLSGIITFDSILELVKGIIDITNPLFVILIILTTIISYISELLMIYLSMALGQKHNSHKIIYSVVYYLVIYSVMQIVSTIILIIPILISPKYFEIFINNEAPSLAFLNMYFIFALIVTALMSIGFYLATTKTLEKKLNLE